PRSLAGRSSALALRSLRDFGLHGAAGASAAHGFEAMYGAAVKDALHGTSREAFEAMQVLKAADPARAAAGTAATYPPGGLGDSLRQIAQLIRADAGLELAFAEVGGWDHHAAEGGAQGQLAARLREFGRSLAAFEKDLGPRMQDVVLVTMTEFGRTARENG